MKKLISAFVVSLVLVIGCQENTSILEPDTTNGKTLNKSTKGDNFNFDELNFDPIKDSIVVDGSGRPGWPRF